ncbi:very short patch repair endonuclease [Cognatishimia activa]|uniref:very short patch repair endonuclease n=1 Tax=Cognatishimia activa TaxID=1715691 RepID=UPI0022305C45|nr:very short patch repair endonuclease [Cognatishimia activa]UZD90050.1 very short patch repair endonuclease [Cognatishimia activa]
MSAIRSKNTKPELLIRRGLHARGFRFRLHDKALPGTPDIVLRRYSALIDVRGCFFHGHDCNLFRLPRTRRDFWESKISTNRRRDIKTASELQDIGWRVAIVWECALRGPKKINSETVIDSLSQWLSSDEKLFEIRGVDSCLPP